MGDEKLSYKKKKMPLPPFPWEALFSNNFYHNMDG